MPIGGSLPVPSRGEVTEQPTLRAAATADTCRPILELPPLRDASPDKLAAINDHCSLLCKRQLSINGSQAD